MLLDLVPHHPQDQYKFNLNIDPEDDEEIDPVTLLLMFSSPKYLNNPKYPKIIASLKEIISLFGTTKSLLSLFIEFIFFIR